MWSLNAHLAMLRQIVLESLPVLIAAVVLSTLAGVAVEKQLAIFAALPALLVLEPAFVSSAGALRRNPLEPGGDRPPPRSRRARRSDPGSRPGATLLLMLVVGFPVFVFNAVGAAVVVARPRPRESGIGWMVRRR